MRAWHVTDRASFHVAPTYRPKDVYGVLDEVPADQGALFVSADRDRLLNRLAMWRDPERNYLVELEVPDDLPDEAIVQGAWFDWEMVLTRHLDRVEVVSVTPGEYLAQWQAMEGG